MENLGYKLMNNSSILIPKGDYNRSVEIRLFDETTFTAGIIVGGIPGDLPRRNLYGNFKFTNAYYPHSSENDFNGTETSVGPWYVAAFACTVLQPTLTYQLSPLKYLGYVKIYY